MVEKIKILTPTHFVFELKSGLSVEEIGVSKISITDTAGEYCSFDGDLFRKLGEVVFEFKGGC